MEIVDQVVIVHPNLYSVAIDHHPVIFVVVVVQ
jgi:hypothetical protein